MAPFKLHGPFTLNEKSIKEHMPRKAPGAFMLGKKHKDGGFAPAFLGRSEADVRTAVAAHIGGEHKLFMFVYSTTPKGAYEKECVLFHDYFREHCAEPLRHPVRPAKHEVRCPECRVMQLVD